MDPCSPQKTRPMQEIQSAFRFLPIELRPAGSFATRDHDIASNCRSGTSGPGGIAASGRCTMGKNHEFGRRAFPPQEPRGDRHRCGKQSVPPGNGRSRPRLPRVLLLTMYGVTSHRDDQHAAIRRPRPLVPTPAAPDAAVRRHARACRGHTFDDCTQAWMAGRRDGSTYPPSSSAEPHDLALARDAGPRLVEIRDQSLHALAIDGPVERRAIRQLVGRLVHRRIVSLQQRHAFCAPKVFTASGRCSLAVPFVERRTLRRVRDGGAARRRTRWASEAPRD